RASRLLSINLIPPTIFNDSSSSDNTNNNYDQYNSTFPRAVAQERAGERVGDITHMGTDKVTDFCLRLKNQNRSTKYSHVLRLRNDVNNRRAKEVRSINSPVDLKHLSNVLVLEHARSEVLNRLTPQEHTGQGWLLNGVSRLESWS